MSGHKLQSSHRYCLVFYPRVYVLQKAFPWIDSSFLVSRIFAWVYKTSVEYGFLSNPLAAGTVNCIEQKTRVFGQTDVQEFHLCTEQKTRVFGQTDV